MSSLDSVIKFAFEEKVGIEITEYEGTPVVSSIQVADNFEKRHNHVLRDIESYREDVSNFGQMFIEGKAPDCYGRDRKIFFITRDGFSFLAMGFTGKKALEWKLKYIEAFNLMEQKLKERVSYADVSPQLQYLIQLERKQNELENKCLALEKKIDDVKEIRDNAIKMTLLECSSIGTKAQKAVSNAVNKRCIEICKTPEMYDAINRRIKGFIYSDIQRDFGVGSYKSLNYEQLNAVMTYVINYEPDMRIYSAIAKAQRNMKLDTKIIEAFMSDDKNDKEE